MTRKSLCREIEIVNQRLNLTQTNFQLVNEQSKMALQQLNPYLMIGAGFLAGVMTNVVGWRNIYSFVGMGFSFYPFLISTFAADEYV